MQQLGHVLSIGRLRAQVREVVEELGPHATASLLKRLAKPGITAEEASESGLRFRMAVEMGGDSNRTARLPWGHLGRRAVVLARQPKR
jgi:hypothetical protein